MKKTTLIETHSTTPQDLCKRKRTLSKLRALNNNDQTMAVSTGTEYKDYGDGPNTRNEKRKKQELASLVVRRIFYKINHVHCSNNN